MTRASFQTVQAVPVENLLLDLSNARIRSGQDQADCISRILRKEAQFLALATDIAVNGLSTQPVLVQPSGKSFIVWDGNRRVTALKLLNDPKLCPVTLVRKKLEALVTQHRANVLPKIDVLSSSDQKVLIAEVLKRHGGELGGVGQVSWNAFLRSVFLASHNIPDDNRRAAYFFLWAESHGINVADDTKITSLTRFSTIENLRLLGFEIAVDGAVTLHVPLAKAIAVAEKVAFDFGPAGEVKVGAVFEPAAAREYIATVLKHVGLEDRIPKTPGQGGGPAKGGPRPKPDDDGTDGGEETAKPKPPRKPLKESWDRKRLLSRSGRPTFNVPESEKKVSNIIVELGKIDVNDAPLAVAALLRMLIEFSEKYYRRHHRGIPTHSKRRIEIQKVAEHMRASDKIDAGDFTMLQRYLKEETSLLHYDTLNAYIHGYKVQPVGPTLCQFYDEIEPFVRACWS